MMNNCAIILAAGIGSRLYPITQEFPKSLVKVNGKEILSYQIDGYLSSGIKEENIYIVTGYKHEMILKYLGKNYPKVKEIYSEDYLSTNNMYSLYLALKKVLASSFDNVFINNADCLYDEELMQEFVSSSYKNIIACEVGTYIEESMKITIRNDGKVVNIAKTISPNDAYAVSIDLYKYSQRTALRLYEIIKDFIEVRKDLKQWTEVAFPELFKTENVYPFDIKHKKWVEVDNNEDLLLADKLFSDFDLNSKKALICDMDGTLYTGNTPINEAIDFIKSHSEFDYYFFTNNTSKTPLDYVKKLQSMGIPCNDEDILTPLYPLVSYLKEKQYTSVYVVATNNVRDFLKSTLPNVDFRFDLEKNQAIILTYDTEITYDKLRNISILLNNKNIEFLATHKDIFCPSEQGPIPDIGSFIQLIKLTTGKEPSKIFGKPSLELVREVMSKYSNNEIAVVGDRLYTDKALADNMNCDFICVLSGETTRLDIQQYIGKIYPKIVLKNLGELIK